MQVRFGGEGSCCGSGCGANSDPITCDLHDRGETSIVPDAAVKASLGDYLELLRF